MSAHDIMGFLLPNFADPIQVAFMSILLLMMGLTIISTHMLATPKSWENKWNRGTPNDESDDLDIEHGSVTDLWHAVATAPEKMAEIMPGMLLVVGLLGTFLGLGLALNHASNILGQPDAMNASAAASSMQDLLGLLQGLGTKFKTSTWGISGFVLLKIWAELTRVEEKRLSWVIHKVKTELDKRKSAISFQDEAKQQALFHKLHEVSNNLVDNFTRNLTLAFEQNGAHYENSEKLLKFTNKNILDFNANSNKDNLLLHSAIQEQTTALCAVMKEIKANTADTMHSMRDFTQNTGSIVQNMAEAAQRMAGGADRVGGAAGELVNAIEQFKTQFTDVLDNVRLDLGAAITNMSTQASQTLEQGSKQLGEATREISTALGQLSSDVKTTMVDVKNSINNSLIIQQKASQEFITSTRTLNEKMVEITSMLHDELGEPIKIGLSAISSSNRQIKGVGDSLDKSITSLETVIKNLIMLPDSLMPLKHLTEAPKKIENLHLEVVKLHSALEPIQHVSSHTKNLVTSMSNLSLLPEHSKAMLNEIQGLRDDIKISMTRPEFQETSIEG
ncbi:hypothetical protein ABHF91_13705 [Pseudaeromonas sp. ZJS20]|uniref:hypothetical protein n=1 Tax=Pseudaeromonas aegiceratis TaxID=3153928 RepID=UPI00390CA1D4